MIRIVMRRQPSSPDQLGAARLIFTFEGRGDWKHETHQYLPSELAFQRDLRTLLSGTSNVGFTFTNIRSSILQYTFNGWIEISNSQYTNKNQIGAVLIRYFEFYFDRLTFVTRQATRSGVGAGVSGSAGYTPPQQQPQQPLDAGVLGVVTVYGNNSSNQQQQPPSTAPGIFDQLAALFSVTKETATIGAILALVVLAAKD